MRWICPCGKQMSNTLCPSPNGYVVFTDEEWDNFDENRFHNEPDYQYNHIDAYTCPDCGRIMIFKVGEDGMFEERFTSYCPENLDNDIDLSDIPKQSIATSNAKINPYAKRLKEQAKEMLEDELSKGLQSAENEGWISEEEIKDEFRKR